MPDSTEGWIALSINLTILGAPVWVPMLMVAYHGFTTKPFWRFSLRFLFALIAAECVALAISVAFYRWLTWLIDSWPIPD